MFYRCCALAEDTSSFPCLCTNAALRFSPKRFWRALWKETGSRLEKKSGLPTEKNTEMSSRSVQHPFRLVWSCSQEDSLREVYVKATSVLKPDLHFIEWEVVEKGNQTTLSFSQWLMLAGKGIRTPLFGCLGSAAVLYFVIRHNLTICTSGWIKPMFLCVFIVSIISSIEWIIQAHPCKCI